MADPVRDPSDAPAHAARLIAAAREAEGAARVQLAGAVVELFAPETARLTDYQRATVTQLLDALVGEIEGALRGRVASGLAPACGVARFTLDAMRVPIARPLLDRARALHDPELVALLLRRAEEHRCALMLRLPAIPAAVSEPLAAATPEPAGGDIVALLVGDRDKAIADAAAAFSGADARRSDRFRGPALPAAELPAELLHRLAWLIAAAVRAFLIDVQAVSAADADAAIVPAANAVLAEHDESRSVDAGASGLARALARAGRLGDAMVEAFAEGGRLALLVASLAVRAQVDQAAAWEMTLAPGGDRLALLLRAAGVGRPAAAAILLRLAPDAALRVAAQLDGWDAIDAAAAREALRLWRLDRAYREAIVALSPAAPDRGA